MPSYIKHYFLIIISAFEISKTIQLSTIIEPAIIFIFPTVSAQTPDYLPILQKD